MCISNYSLLSSAIFLQKFEFLAPSVFPNTKHFCDLRLFIPDILDSEIDREFRGEDLHLHQSNSYHLAERLETLFYMGFIPLSSGTNRTSNHGVDWNSPQIILLTQICENEGQSVTNAIEYIAPQAVNYLKSNIPLFTPDNCIVVEHYNQNSYTNYYDFLDGDEILGEKYSVVKQDAGFLYWQSLTYSNFYNLVKGKKIHHQYSLPRSFYYHNWSKNKFEKIWKYARDFLVNLQNEVNYPTLTA